MSPAKARRTTSTSPKRIPPIAAGQRFHRLVAIEFVDRRVRSGKRRNRFENIWRFRCDCGRETIVPEFYVRLGNTKSCGCWRSLARRKHGQAAERKLGCEYQSWLAMKQRCTNPRSVGYASYGGRGILVCERWMESFEVFLADVGPRPTPRHTLDRADNNGNYEPGNVRWATMAQQSRNKRRTVEVRLAGKLMCLKDACQQARVDYSTIRQRLGDGWTLQEALDAPRLGRWTYRITPQMIDAAAIALEALCLPICGTLRAAAEAALKAAVDAHPDASTPSPSREAHPNSQP